MTALLPPPAHDVLREQLIRALASPVVSADVVYDTAIRSGITVGTELDKWHKFIRNSKGHPKRPFQPILTCGDLADEIQSRLDRGDTAHTVFKEARERASSLRRYSTTELEFKDEFSKIAQLVTEGAIPHDSAVMTILQLIRRYSEMAYLDGMADGGAAVDFSVQDAEVLQKLIADQKRYVIAFVGALTEETFSPSQITNRADLWFTKSIGVMYYSGLVSASRDALYEWQIGATERHCTSCLALNGQRHRLSEYVAAGFLPQSTGTKTLLCKGFYCDCGLRRVRGKARGDLSAVPFV